MSPTQVLRWEHSGAMWRWHQLPVSLGFHQSATEPRVLDRKTRIKSCNRNAEPLEPGTVHFRSGVKPLIHYCCESAQS